MDETLPSEMPLLTNPHGATSRKTAFFIVAAVNTSCPTSGLYNCQFNVLQIGKFEG
jgi:hypothetical protein